MNNEVNYHYEIGEYIEVVNPFKGFENYKGKRGVIKKRCTQNNDKAYSVQFDGEPDTSRYVWYEKEIASYINNLIVSSEEELLDLLS